ncbi:MAG: 1-deoxy-D-xylulose-5-phosphate synthase, partial [Muribaculaceae bacterium]|nr:1-deoxy-D-xylulose-5-phosphate synthase [Muribaculaceae bacterium]
DVGISEGHAVTFAGGLAKDGLHPFCCIYSSFLQRGYDEIIHDVAIQKLPVTFCIDRGGLVGEDGVTHHGVFDLAYLRIIPNVIVSAPINEHWLRNLMFTSQLEGMGPFAIRYPRGNGVLVDWRNKMAAVEIGRGQILNAGDAPVAVLSLGDIGNEVIKATARLKDEGVNVTHYDMVFLKPIDEEILDTVCRDFSHVITVEDGAVNGGLGSAVAEWIACHGYNTGLTRLGVPDEFVYQGTVDQLRHQCGIDSESIENQIRTILNNKEAL